MSSRLVRLAGTLLLAGCVTHIKPSVTSNPPPRTALNAYQRFELLPLGATPEARREDAAVRKIEQNLAQQVGSLIATWNRAGDGRTLRIEPTVTELKFVSTGERLLAGGLAGSSAVVMKVRLVDGATGEVVAEPEFFQRANAIGGAYSFGASDNGMLDRIAIVAREYLVRNYDQAVGGPTGLDEPRRAEAK
jgi:hypothetical protein